MTAIVQKTKKPYYGLNFIEAVSFSGPVTSTMTIDDKNKLELEGNLVLDFHRDSYRYPNQAVLGVWNYKYPTVQPRPINDGYGRNEVILPISTETRDFFLACAYEIDCRLKGVK